MIELARIQVELFHPGATMKGPKFLEWYSGSRRFHAHRTLVPMEPLTTVLAVEDDTLTVVQKCAMINIQPIGEAIIGIASGVTDHLMLVHGIRHALGSSLPQIVHVAEEHAPPTARSRSAIAWIGMFEVDEEKAEVIYLGRLSLEGLTCKIW